MKKSLAQSLKRHKTVILKQEIEARPSLLRRIGRGVVRVFALIGFLLVTSMTIGIVIGLMQSAPSHPSRFDIVHEFTGDPDMDAGVEGFLADPFAEPPMDLNELLFKIRAAAKDPRVTGMVVRITDGDYSLAMIEEIHAAMDAFHEAGKTSMAYASSLGLLSNGMGEYLLASAFNEIWLAPQGTVSPTGFYAEIPYYRDALAHLGVEAEMQAIGTYKTGPESMTRQGMSAEQSEMLSDILDNNMAVAARLLVMDVAGVEEIIDNAPYTAEEARDAGLIDGVIQSWEMEHNGDILPLAAYRPKGTKTDPDHRLALIRIHGVILEDEFVTRPQANPIGMLDENWVDPAETARLILEHGQRDDISALILDVDSPGGSPAGSEMIRQAILDVREDGMPVFVTMGAQAASGGYWISADAERIWALPSTVTGSIGVYGGKFDLSALWQNWGVNWDSAGRGDRAGIWSMNKPYTVAEQAHIRAQLQDIYERFVALVAKGRGMTASEAEELAQGRVWTGVQAVENGLVDALGGVQDAIDHAKAMLGVEAGRSVVIETYPMPEPFFDRVVDGLSAPVRISIPSLDPSLSYWMSPPAQRALWVPPGLAVSDGL